MGRTPLGKRSIAGKFLELATDSATYGASNVIGRVITFLLLPLYTRYLDTSAYGALAMLNLLQLLFVPAANLGMSNAVFRHFNTSKDHVAREEVFGTALLTTTVWSVALFALGQLFAGPLTELFISDPRYIPLVRLSLGSALFLSLARTTQTILRADRRAKLLASMNLCRLVLAVGLTVYLVIFARQGVRGVIVANLIADVAVVPFLLWTALGRFRPRPRWQRWREMARYGLPFAPHQLQSVAISAFGLYVVRYVLSLDEAGIYNVAARFAAPVALIVNAVQMAWVPFKFQIHAEDDDPKVFFRSAMTYYVLGVSVLWVGLAVWAPEVVRLMTAPAFHRAAVLVPLLTAVPIARGLYFMSGSGFELGSDTRAVPLVSFFGLLTVVIGSVTLVPHFAAHGAAIATLAAWVVMAGCAYRMSQRQFQIEYDWATVGLLILGSGLVSAGAILMQDSSLAVRLTCALMASILYPLAAVGVTLLGGTDSEPLHRLWALARQRRT